jgi:hypothetical protein
MSAVAADACGGDARRRFRSAQGQTFHPFLLCGSGIQSRNRSKQTTPSFPLAREWAEGVDQVERNVSNMSELFLPSRQRVPAIVPPLLSFTAGFIDSFTVLALFGLALAEGCLRICVHH